MGLVSEPRDVATARVRTVLGAAEVWSRVQARHERAVLELDRLVATCFDRVLTADECARGAALCAALADAFTKLSFGPGGDLVAQVASALAGEPPGPERAEKLSIVVEDLHSVLAATGSEAPAQDPDAPTILVVGASSRFTDGVLWLATTRGLSVVHGDDAPDPIEDVACVVVAVDADDVDVARSTVTSLAERYPGVPLVFCTGNPDVELRIAVAPHAASTLVGAAPADAVGEVHALIARADAPCTVGVLGPSAEQIVAALRDRSIDAAPFDGAADLVAAIRNGGVQAVLLGADVDRALRRSLPALVRSDPRTRDIGIVSLTAGTESDDDAIALLQAGADVVLPQAVDPDVLGASCRARLRHSLDRAASARADRSGLLGQQHAALLLEAMLVAAHRQRALVSIGVLTFEDGCDDDARAAEVAEVLGREFRREDVLGRWNDGRFVVALKGVSRRVAVRRFEELLRHVNTNDPCRVGVAEFPHDGRVLEELLATADWAALRARLGDGPRVVSSEWQVDPDEGPDVLVVDPDVTLRALIATLLERQGLNVVQANDGVSALEYLTGPQNNALPRVLLLELDLTGIDGLQLLRRLDESGIMSRLRAMVLTARIRESELLEALSLGASDVVTKPFSPALLVHRLRRVLES